MDPQNMYRTMAVMQDAHNTVVASDWRTAGFPFYRAIWTECAEMLDHYGWKWWKQQTPDSDQVKLEVVDIWHFGLSDLILRNADAEELHDLLHIPAAEAPSHPDTFRESIEDLAFESLERRAFPTRTFARVMAGIPMGLEELFRLYIGKNALNHFRQGNGYADGTYIKTWAGREDNEHLIEVLHDLDPNIPENQVFAAVTGGLTSRYRTLCERDRSAPSP